MKSAKVFKRIENDRFYLLKQYKIELLFWSIATVLVYQIRDYSSIDFHVSDVLYFIPAVLFGWFVSGLIHNTSHQNIKNQYVNRFLGEFSGLWLMYGFKNFILIHFLHHKYSDREFDPVNPEGMNFLVFLTAPMRYMISRARGFLFYKFAEYDDYKKIYTSQYILFHFGLLARLGFLLALFGPKLFIVFYIPSLIGNISILAHINFACHRNVGEETVEVVNLNHNLYYKLANFITSGGYFHKNHHLNPNLYNPSVLETKRSKLPLITKGPIVEISDNPPIYGGSILEKYFDINSIWGNGEKNIIIDPNKENLPLRNIYWEPAIGL